MFINKKTSIELSDIISNDGNIENFKSNRLSFKYRMRRWQTDSFLVQYMIEMKVIDLLFGFIKITSSFLLTLVSLS